MLKGILSKLFRSAIYGLGYSNKVAFVSMSTGQALKRIMDRGIEIHTVIDVGASNGIWSIEAEHYLNASRYHLIEADKLYTQALEKLCRVKLGFSHVIAAASDEPGTVLFDDSGVFAGLAMKTVSRDRPTARSVVAVTLDGEVKTQGLEGPYLVKLDTHGFEVPILNGAKDVLANANLVVIEAYNFQLEPDSLKFWEMCQFMDQRGFSVIDISEPLWRPKDGAFWQMDLFFIPKNRPEFSYNRYT